MREISTLIYLVDDLNLPSDTLLQQNQMEFQLVEEHCVQMLNRLAIDPGEDLIARIMQQIKK